MGQIALPLPVLGLPNASEDVKIDNAFTILQTWANGNIDASNISPTLALSAAVNESGQVVKGASNIATSETRTNAAYGLMPTPDQVANVVLDTNGLIEVWFQGTWQESVAGAARAAIFLGSNQVVTAASDGAAPYSMGAATGSPSSINTNFPLASFNGGLCSGIQPIAYTGDATTGQIVGVSATGAGVSIDIGGGSLQLADHNYYGGPCHIFAAAGTYTVSVQFKASSGNVVASNRKLWVRATSFA